MAFATSARRDQRRRLVASWNRPATASAPSDTDAPAAGRVAAYDDAAHPERHPGLATRLPTSFGGLFLSSAVILVGTGAAIGLAISGPLFGQSLWELSGRFAGTLGVVRRAVESTTSLALHGWLAVLALFAAAAVAGSIKHMRRHRRDDYKGRFRAWGWLATIFTCAAWSAVVPLGSLVSAFACEATGITLGPGGIGWWYAASCLALTITVPWAILPLRERGGTVTWTTLALIAWGVAASMPWTQAWGGGPERGALLAAAAWSGGAAIFLVAMLTAARGVIREVRGEVAASQPPKARREKKRDVRVERQEDAADENDSEEQVQSEEDSADSDNEDSGSTDFTDGSFGDERRLSKAERKRLKKLARMNGHAA